MHTVHTVNAALPFLELSKTPSIVVISSVSGREIDIAARPYGTMKAAFIHYAAGLAYQLAGKGIRVNTVSPGNTYFEGGIWHSIKDNKPDFFKQALDLNPTGRMAAAASIALPTYLRDFNIMQSARAQGSGPVKLGFIEDESGNLAVCGLQKLHAAQLAVKEINDGKTLKGAPIIGAGFLGAMGQAASKPPVISKEGTALDTVDDGGAKDKTDLVYEEDSEILIDSGEKGVLGRGLQLVSSGGQSNNSVWQQLARRMIQEDKVDVLVAGFASAEREAIRPIVDQFKQLYFYTNQYEGVWPTPTPSAPGRFADRRSFGPYNIWSRSLDRVLTRSLRNIISAS